MAVALVVDDSKVDQQLAGNLLRKCAAMDVVYAENGNDAIAAIQEHQPKLVITDLQMPQMNGLELVEHIRCHHPAIPVILMTAHGSEEVASEALRKGAASYVPKKFLARDLGETIKRMLALADAQRQQDTVLECLDESTANFVLCNDSSRIHALIHYLRQDLQRFRQWDENELMRVGVALDEALANAVQHGNLEVDSMLRDEGVEIYNALLDERRELKPYKDRRIHVNATINRSAARFVVRDEGKGFDPAALPDPTDPANLERVHGRGLLLIRTFMDEVTHNEAGNEITIIKYCKKESSEM